MNELKIISVKMLQTTKGSPNGVNVQGYFKGETYSIPESLAKVFIENKFAEEVSVKKEVAPEPPKEESPKKADPPANKKVTPPSNKGTEKEKE